MPISMSNANGMTMSKTRKALLDPNERKEIEQKMTIIQTISGITTTLSGILIICGAFLAKEYPLTSFTIELLSIPTFIISHDVNTMSGNVYDQCQSSVFTKALGSKSVFINNVLKNTWIAEKCIGNLLHERID